MLSKHDIASCFDQRLIKNVPCNFKVVDHYRKTPRSLVALFHVATSITVSTTRAIDPKAVYTAYSNACPSDNIIAD